MLIVDDDIRNIFALTTILEQHKVMESLLAAETASTRCDSRWRRAARGDRPRADGHHDARDGRLRYHSGHSCT